MLCAPVFIADTNDDGMTANGVPKRGSEVYGPGLSELTPDRIDYV